MRCYTNNGREHHWTLNWKRVHCWSRVINYSLLWIQDLILCDLTISLNYSFRFRPKRRKINEQASSILVKKLLWEIDARQIIDYFKVPLWGSNVQKHFPSRILRVSYLTASARETFWTPEMPLIFWARFSESPSDNFFSWANGAAGLVDDWPWWRLLRAFWPENLARLIKTIKVS